MAEVIDYRVSRIVVLCKDCGQDVGLYPARHKCGIPTSEELIIPKESDNSTSNSKTTVSSSSNSEGYNLWNRFVSSAASVMHNVDDDSDNGKSRYSFFLELIQLKKEVFLIYLLFYRIRKRRLGWR